MPTLTMKPPFVRPSADCTWRRATFPEPDLVGIGMYQDTGIRGPGRCRVLASRIRLIPPPSTVTVAASSESSWQYVLGWSSVTSKNDNKDNCLNDGDVVVIAGLLDPGQANLKAYRSIIDRLKQEAEQGNGCKCLTDGLDVIARWTPNGFDDVDNGSRATTVSKEQPTNSLPILDNQRGYVWWNINPTPTLTQESQLLNFGLMESSPYAHFRSESCSKTNHTPTQFATMLNRINHCQEIHQIVISQTIPRRPAHVQGVLQNEESPAPATTTTNDKWISHSEARHPCMSMVERIAQWGLQSSFFILHLQSIWQQSSFSLLCCLSIYRTYQTFRRLSCTKNDPQTHFCDHCGKTCLLALRPKLAQQTTYRWNAFLSAMLDMVAGWLVCAVLLLVVHYYNASFQWYMEVKQSTLTSLIQQIGWLETFPTGFKLNVPLTQKLGYEIRTLLRYQERFLLDTIWNTDIFRSYIVPGLAYLAAVSGGSSFLALWLDMWRLETMQCLLLATFFRNLYQAELFLLSALFRLFRGKKRNLLRQRTDSIKYDAMQLLVGTLGFCICIFLWTTLWYYHSFFCLWNLLAHLPIVGLWTLYLLSRSVPLGGLLWLSIHPEWFPRDVFLKFHMSSEPYTQVSKLSSIPQSPIELLGQTMSHLKQILQWFLNALREAAYPSSSDPFPCSLPLAVFMANLSLDWDDTRSFDNSAVKLPNGEGKEKGE